MKNKFKIKEERALQEGYEKPVKQFALITFIALALLRTPFRVSRRAS